MQTIDATEADTEITDVRPWRRAGGSAEHPLILSARDLEMFEWLAAHRFSTKELLVERFYSTSTRARPGTRRSGRYGVVRLQRLERQGYLKRSRYRVLDDAPIMLSDIGYRVLHGRERAEAFRPLPDIEIENFEHDVWLQRLRIAFERDHSCARWTTERALRMSSAMKALPYVPDARFYSPNQQAWNLEVERTPKRADRLRELLSVRARASKKTVILYVLDRRFSDFYRGLMSVTVNPAAFYITHFDELTHVASGSEGWKKTLLKLAFGSAGVRQ